MFADLDPANPPNYNPNNIITAPITVAGGQITVPWQGLAVGTGTMIAATWMRIAVPPEFIWDGTMGIAWLLKFVSRPANSRPGIYFGFCDKGGNPGSAGRMGSAGMRPFAATTNRLYAVALGEFAEATGAAYTTDDIDAYTLVEWCPKGDVVGPTLPGVATGCCGSVNSSAFESGGTLCFTNDAAVSLPRSQPDGTGGGFFIGMVVASPYALILSGDVVFRMRVRAFRRMIAPFPPPAVP